MRRGEKYPLGEIGEVPVVETGERPQLETPVTRVEVTPGEWGVVSPKVIEGQSSAVESAEEAAQEAVPTIAVSIETIARGHLASTKDVLDLQARLGEAMVEEA